MPEFSGHVTVRFDGSADHMLWDARARRLTGESIIENLQLSVSVDTHIRWTRDGDLVLQALGTSGSEPVRTTGKPLFDASEVSFLNPEVQISSGGRAEQAKAPRVRKPRRASSRSIYTRAEYSWPERNKVGILKRSCASLASSIDQDGWDPPDSYALRMRGEELARVSDFDQLISVNSVRVEPMDHQYAAAVKTLREMRGTAILADEVGLGKTIEAGLIAKELEIRGLARQILIIVPAPLREQWQQELRDKFGIESLIVTSRYQSRNAPVLIMSRQLALNLRQQLHQYEWDLLIADEAHKLAGRTARATRELMDGLNARYRLFLTATPVQNDLTELYRLVNMVRPGTLGTEREFRSRYVSSSDPRQPANPADLRQLVSQVMIRTTRAQAGLDKVKRLPVDVPIDLPVHEKRAYDLVLHVLRAVLTGPGQHLQRDGLAKRLTMSPAGMYESVRRAISKTEGITEQTLLEELAELASIAGPTIRQRVLVDLTRQWIQDPGKGKVLIFTQETRVLSDLVELLASEGLEAVAYHGGLGAQAKNAALASFRGTVPVMISTEAGAEGLNLQHANAVINYDLPWNPMRIEQRIGRVHRVTQRRDVHVANFYARGTVDENVYRILKEKLRMFELLFGQITTILGELGASESSDATFEGLIKKAIYSQSDSAMANRLAQLEQLAEQAHVKASDEIRDSGGVSAWMSPSLDYRASIKSEARELKPQEVVRDTARQEELEAFARGWLLAVGGTIDHESDDFIAVTLPPTMAELMGGDVVHLAFSHKALGNHPSAELFAVGSPIFEDFLDAVSQAGDLVGHVIQVPDLANTAQYPAVPADEGWVLRKRTVEPVEVVGFKAKWLASESNSRFAEELLDLEWGDFGVDPAIHKDASASDRPVSKMLRIKGSDVIKSLQDSCVPALLEHQQMWQYSVNDVFDEERDRHIGLLEDQRSELYAGAANASLAERIAEMRHRKAPRVELRAELLGAEFVTATTVVVNEVWEGPNSQTLTLRGEWSAKDDRLVLSGDDGKPIGALCICGRGHGVDTRLLIACDRCGSRACSQCTTAARRRTACAVCAKGVCTKCISGTPCLVCDRVACLGCSEGGLCVTCRTPVVLSATEINLPTELHAAGLAVRMGHDAGLTVWRLVGDQRDELVVSRSGSEELRWWTLASTPAPLLGEAIAAARHAGAGGNLVVEVQGESCASWPETPASHLLLSRSENSQTVWSVDGEVVETPVPGMCPEPAPEVVLAATLPISKVGTTAQHHVKKLETTVRAESWIDVSGLHEWKATDDVADCATFAWRRPTVADPASDELISGWPEQPAITLLAGSGPDRVELLVLRDHRFVRIVGGVGAESMVFDLDGALAADGPLATGLMASGHLQPTILQSFMPERAPVPAVYGRDGVIRFRTAGYSGILRTKHEAVHRLFGEAMPDRLVPVVQGLRDPGGSLTFVDELIPAPDPAQFSRLDLGWHFESALTTLHGQERVFTYDTFMTNGVPALYDDLGNVLGASAKVCDEGHLAQDVDVCGYCTGRFCPRCSAGMSACLTCGHKACVTCLDSRGTCQACRSVKRRGWFGRRHERKQLDDLTGLLEGRDELHQVEFLVRKSGLYCRVTERSGNTTELQVPLTPEVAQALGLKNPR
jgi:superfamily II DNA or RNA helicase